MNATIAKPIANVTIIPSIIYLPSVDAEYYPPNAPVYSGTPSPNDEDAADVRSYVENAGTL